MSVHYWILDENHEPVRSTVEEWAVWFENSNNRIVETTDIPYPGAEQRRLDPTRSTKILKLPLTEKVVTNTVTVSTIFLGLDHRFSGYGPPILFETMIFGGPHDEYMDRCCTWDEALKMHKRGVWLARGADEEPIVGGAA